MYYLNIIAFTHLTFYIGITNSFSPKPPLWSWDCVDEKCVPVKTNQAEKLQSFETCIVLCSSVHLWPLPTGTIKLIKKAVPVRTDTFVLKDVIAPNDIIRQYVKDAFLLIKQDLRNMETANFARGNEYKVVVSITVNDNGDPRTLLGTDESYHLSLKPVSLDATTVLLEITSHSFSGARNALETALQMVWFDPYLDSLLILQEAIVTDAPRFKYRGLMIDTARNYIPFSELLRTVDAMGASKLNTLHWHVSDSQAFSLILNSVPQLSRYGAYSDVAVYTPDQVRVLTRRARLRGVRVLIEVDIPAHVGNAWDWGATMGKGDMVFCTGSDTWTAYCDSPPCGQLNPLNSYVFDILHNIYAEIMQLTEVDDIIHLGGSDISFKCWSDYLENLDPIVLWLDFIRSTLQRIENINEKLPELVILWNSRVSEKIKWELKDIIHMIGFQTRNTTWSENNLSGLRTIISHEDAWDLNDGHGSWNDNSLRGIYNSWQKVYEHRPWVRSGLETIIGGEATLWSWTLSEAIDLVIWPRAAALAERLWTDHPEGVTRSAQIRLDMHRLRLAIRGVQAAPLWSHWCTQYPSTCI